MGKRSFQYIDKDTVKKHFLDRLDERYGIKNVTYEDVLELPRTYLYNKGINRIVKITIGRRDVIAMWNKDQKLLKTVFPAEVEVEMESAIRACFARVTRGIAYQIYKEMRFELDNEKFDFETKREAALYYKKRCKFSELLIAKFINPDFKVAPFKLCTSIHKILTNESSTLKITVSRKDLSVDTKNNKWKLKKRFYK